jgi:RND family efflux transporter MFP subunit
VLARIDQARSDVASAELNAAYARITSPVSGIVTAKQTDVGQTATPGAPLLTVEDDSLYRIEAAVEESRIGSVSRGDQMIVLIDALGDKEFAGKVDEIVPAADPASRSFTIKVSVPAEAARLGIRSGLFGKARFSGAQKQAVLVPRAAVIERGQLIGVFTVDQSGIARMRIIKTGKNYGDNLEVLSGLSPGEEIVASGADLVREGSRLR